VTRGYGRIRKARIENSREEHEKEPADSERRRIKKDSDISYKGKQIKDNYVQDYGSRAGLRKRWKQLRKRNQQTQLPRPFCLVLIFAQITC